MRVVSLVPSLTETLFDLGAGSDVVGITDFCIFPPDLALPRVGGTKNPHVDEIRALAPDLVYVNMEENLKRHADAIAEFTRVHVSEPKTVDDVATLIEDLGGIHGRRERAAELVKMLRETQASFPPRTFSFACPIWKNPWMWCGGDTYVSNLVEVAGGTNVLRDRNRYPQIALDEVLALRPDVILLPDEPYAFTKSDADAIQAPHVIGPFPGHLFTWHGTRTILGLAFLKSATASLSWCHPKSWRGKRVVGRHEDHTSRPSRPGPSLTLGMTRLATPAALPPTTGSSLPPPRAAS